MVTSLTYVNAQNVFRDETSTLEGYSTWDSDMINIEAVSETGEGVYVAVLDTGLAPNWADYFPDERIATELGIGFYEELYWNPEINDFETTGVLHTETFIGSIGTTHGTHVTSTIIGYFYESPYDEYWGYDLPPIMVRGIAPEVTIIPVKVLADYRDGGGNLRVFGTWRMVAAGIKYIADLKAQLNAPVIISMSLGGGAPSEMIEEAIDYAIEKGVIVVAAAGNQGKNGMSWPGAYPQVISAGACGWRYEWWWPTPPDDGNGPDEDYIHTYDPSVDGRNRLWWLQSDYTDVNKFIDVSETTDLPNDVYVTDFSSREISDHPYGEQDLDVLAPGSWVRGPYPGYPGYAHLPWWSEGIGSLVSGIGGNFYYVGGTSMAAPHVSAVAALVLQINPNIDQSAMECLLESTALEIPVGEMRIVDIVWDFATERYKWAWNTVSWDIEAIGAGLLQADKAIMAALS